MKNKRTPKSTWHRRKTDETTRVFVYRPGRVSSSGATTPSSSEIQFETKNHSALGALTLRLSIHREYREMRFYPPPPSHPSRFRDSRSLDQFTIPGLILTESVSGMRGEGGGEIGRETSEVEEQGGPGVGLGWSRTGCCR